MPPLHAQAGGHAEGERLALHGGRCCWACQLLLLAGSAQSSSPPQALCHLGCAGGVASGEQWTWRDTPVAAGPVSCCCLLALPSTVCSGGSLPPPRRQACTAAPHCPQLHSGLLLQWVPEESPSTPVLRLPAIMKEQPRRARGAKWEAPSRWASKLGSRLARVARTALCIPCFCPPTSPEAADSDSENAYFESSGAGNQTGGEGPEAPGSEGNTGELRRT